MSIALRIIGVFLALLLWHLAAGQSGMALVPSPIDVIRTCIDQASLLWSAALATLERLVAGVFAGFALATALAIAGRRFHWLRLLTDGPIETLRPIPPIALTPFFIILLGLDAVAQISLIGLGTFMIFYVGWSEAFRRTPEVLLRSAASLGYSGWELIVYVMIPHAWPSQKPIWRVAIATGLALSVAAEYLGAQGGLGYVIRNARTILDLGLVAAASLILGIIAIVLDRVVIATIDLTSQWTKRSEASDG